MTKTTRKFEPRYREIAMVGTRLSDRLPDDATWHQRFNWVCNVVRDVRLYGGGSTLKQFFKVNFEILRKERETNG